MINETKLQVIENNVTDIGEINNIVNNVSNNYDVTMSQDQSDEIAALMQKIAQQDYDITQLKATLERVQANVAGDAGASEEQQAEAEKKAQEAEAAAEEQTQESEAAQDNADITIDGAQDQTENILDNTDISALDPNATNASESTTTQTVLEQTEAETEGDNGTGIPEATGDGTVTSEAAETEAITEAATEAGAETESTIKAEDLDPEKKAIYDEVKSNLDQAYTEKQVTGDDGTVVYLTEDAAKKLPEAVEKYLLKVLAEGADKVAQEEALDTEIPQNIVEETQDLAEDKHYEDADLVQMDKYVRRLVLKDSEKILEDSQLENNDAVVVYRSIMVILEAGFGVEQPDLESEAAVSEDAAQEAPAEEQNEDSTEDEFADFQEETGTF